MANGFPLFMLPAVPLRVITRELDFHEILLLSHASRKSAYIIRSLLPRILFHLRLSLWHETKITFDSSKHLWNTVTSTVTAIDHNCDANGYELQVGSNRWAWSSLEEALKSLLTRFAMTFNPIISLNFGYGCHEECVMAVLNHVEHLNLKKKSIQISTKIFSPKSYKYLLEQWKGVSELFLICKTAPDFEYRAVPEFEIDDFHVDDAHWIYLEDFINCRKFTVSNQSRRRNDFRCAKPEVLRAFIRKWIESNCRLEYLKIFSDPVEMNFEDILSGLEYRTVESEVSDYQFVEITRKCDGKKATVKHGEYVLELKIIE